MLVRPRPIYILMLAAICGSAQQRQNICLTYLQFWTNVEDFRPTLYKFYANVLCLLGAVNRCSYFGVHFFRISRNKLSFMSENKIFSNGHQGRKIKINAEWWTNCTRWFYNLHLSIIPLEQKRYFMNCKVRLNMANWQRNFIMVSGTWELRNMGTFVCIWSCVWVCVCAEYTKP